MLVLKRRVDEKIRIGDDITIQVTEVGNGGVKLGITAPASVPVHREEIYQAIKARIPSPKNTPRTPTPPPA